MHNLLGVEHGDMRGMCEWVFGGRFEHVPAVLGHELRDVLGGSVDVFDVQGRLLSEQRHVHGLHGREQLQDMQHGERCDL